MGLLYQIQHLRAVAVLAVFYFHSVQILNDHGFALGKLYHDVGPVGVDLFFVISGFIMARIAAREVIKPVEFMVARVRRIAPIYWLATFLLFAVAFYFPALLSTTKADFVQLLHSLLFIPNGQSEIASSPILVVGWTLNYEMFFYVLVAIAAGILRDRRLVTVIAVLAILVAMGQFYKSKNGYIEFYTDPIVLEFGLGIFVHHIWSAQKQPVGAVFLVFSIVVMCAIILGTKQFHLSDARPLISGLPCALIVYATINLKFGTDSLIKKIGDWSYGIYIWHVFLIGGVVKITVAIIEYEFSTLLINIGIFALILFSLLLVGIFMNIIFSPIRGNRYSGHTDNSTSWREQ